MMRRIVPNVFTILGILALAVVLGSGTAGAATYDWNVVTNGEYTTPGSWSPSGPPGAADMARWDDNFNGHLVAGKTNNITLAQSKTNDSVQFWCNIVNFDLMGNTWYVTNSFMAGFHWYHDYGNSDPVVTVTNGTLIVGNGSGGALNFGGNSAATLTIGAGAQLQYLGTYGSFDFGDNYSCTLNVTNGGKALSPGNSFTLGAWASCVINVAGGGSVFSNYSLSAGNGGGNINVTGGGRVDTSWLTYTWGTCRVSGPSSYLWQHGAANRFWFGYFGDSSLVVSNRANVEADAQCLLALNATGPYKGSIIVDNATLTNHAGMWAGQQGTGSVNIVNGGLICNQADSGIGLYASAIGRVTVDGAGSVLTNGRWNVGWYGQGTMIITNGGRVYSSSSDGIGTWAGAVGRVEVVGNGSRWDGGNNSGGYIGLGDAGGIGSMLVGTGAVVNSAGQFYVSPGSTLELAGGTVQAGAAPWIRLAGPTTVFKGWGTVLSPACTTNAGIFIPGGTNGIGTLSFNTNLTLLASTTTTVYFANNDSAGQAVVHGNLALAGELNLNFPRAVSGRYVIFHYDGTCSGSFVKTNWVGFVNPQAKAFFDGNDYVVNVPLKGTMVFVR